MIPYLNKMSGDPSLPMNKPNEERKMATARQWFPGRYIEGVQEIVHDPGDGSTKSNAYGMLGAAKVNPGDWIIEKNPDYKVVATEEGKAREALKPFNVIFDHDAGCVCSFHVEHAYGAKAVVVLSEKEIEAIKSALNQKAAA